jgi:ABC-type transport system substrate-binding protein/class 3 adenylate cyclase/streptogramin lyase
VSEPRDISARSSNEPPLGSERGDIAPASDESGISTEASANAPETELRTFLIADIRGYTTYTREHGDEAGAALAEHFAELVREVVTARDGFLLELRGDEALVVFVSARKALRAAIDLQARFIEVELPRGVGIGLDAGEAIPVGDGYRGTALNLAARLCAQAGSGETLASEAVIHLAAKMDGIAYVDPRSLKLKGYSDSVRAVVVVPSDRAKGRRLASGNGSRGTDRRRYAIAGVAVIVVALLAGVLGGGLLGRSGATPTGAADASGTAGPAGDARSTGSPSASSDPLAGADLPVLAFFDAKSGALKATTPLTAPTNISFFSGGSFWILGENPRAFNRIDPVSHKVVQSIPVPAVEARGYAFGDDSIWITDGAGPHVLRVDQRTGVVSTFPFGSDPSDMRPAFDVTVGGGSVWLSRPDAREIVRLDPGTGKLQARISDVEAYGVAFGEGALWFTSGERLGRIDPATNDPTFDPVLLAPNGILGNISFGGGDAWTAESSSGHVWKVDRAGRQYGFAIDAGVGELRSTTDTMWVTNANTGKLTGIDLVTGDTNRAIDTGHATLAVAAGGDEIMVAVGPTVDEVIAGLEGSILTLAASGSPWTDPSPDPALNGNLKVRQVLYLTCAALLNYPDAPAPDGWTLQPEVAAAMPTISPDGRTYTFRIRPGFRFSPPSNEEVTAETFRATIERAVSPVLDDDAPGPSHFGDIVGVKEFRAGKVDHVTGLVASGDQLTITLQAPAPDILQRLAMPFVCPVPAGTPVLRSGLDPDPPISGAGPYYLFTAGRHSVVTSRLVILKRNPNYHGQRPQPFDNIAIRTRSATASSIGKVRDGKLDAAMLDGGETISSGAGAVAAQWGPRSAGATAGDQRWFGAPGLGTNYLVLNPSRPAFRDPDVRRAVSLALDRVALSNVWVIAPSAELLAPSVPGTAGPDAPVPPPDRAAALALMKGRTLKVTMMGFPLAWECGQCRDFEVAITGQLKEIGVTVAVRHPDDFPADAFAPASTVDLINWGSGSDYPDPVGLIASLGDDPWLGKANLGELARLQKLSGQARIDGTVGFAHRIVDEQVLVVPYGYPVEPFFMAERIGCGFVQPAIGAVDLLSLCIRDPGATQGASPQPSTSPGP